VRVVVEGDDGTIVIQELRGVAELRPPSKTEAGSELTTDQRSRF
jgi:hypothetical protein